MGQISEFGKIAAILRRAMRGEEVSWPDRMLVNHHFADKMLPKICERYKSKRIHAFRMVIERVFSFERVRGKEPLVYFEQELLAELFKVLKKAAKIAELAQDMKRYVARNTAAKLRMAPST